MGSLYNVGFVGSELVEHAFAESEHDDLANRVVYEPLHEVPGPSSADGARRSDPGAALARA
jgi:hypothetical protein